MNRRKFITRLVSLAAGVFVAPKQTRVSLPVGPEVQIVSISHSGCRPQWIEMRHYTDCVFTVVATYL